MTLGLLATATIQQEGIGAAAAILVLDSSGLAFHDDFNRPDAGSVGNGWLQPIGTPAEISASQLHFDGGFINVWRGIDQGFVFPSESITHHTANRGDLQNFNTFNRVFEAISGSSRGEYSTQLAGGVRIFKWLTGSVNQIAGPTGSSALWNSPFSLRTVIAESAPRGADISVYVEENISNNDDITKDFSGGPILSANDAAVTLSFDKVAMFGHTTDIGHWYICGRNINVSGLSTGRKIRFINDAGTGSFVAETAGVASFDVDRLALPGNRVEVFESDETTFVAAFQSASGVWGGDRYSVIT